VNLLLAVAFLCFCLPASARTQRSHAARSAFMHAHPCPSTGKTSGSCPGYVVDHVKPLECGGHDKPSNMQWQTIERAKEKDKTEALCAGPWRRDRMYTSQPEDHTK